MAYKSLYRSYRPQQFSEVIGQQHIVQTLKNAIARDQLAHAYLFTGSRGTGKTTIAKLLAKGINCLNPNDAPCNKCEMCVAINQETHPDIIEIDAASNNSVDDVRDLIERVKYAPLQAKKKVYIIDEVHMLSTGAFNALLKTLEEPPEHVVFILATTEVHKVLPTIISRCQRYDFTRISNKDIIQNLNRVIKAEKLKVKDGVVEMIANLANGGHRDSLTILEQAIAYSKGPITVEDLRDLYRVSSPEDKKELILSILNQDLVKGLGLLEELETKSVDYQRYLFDFVSLNKEALVYSLTNNLEMVSDLNKEAILALNDHKIDDLLLTMSNQMIRISEEARLNGQYQSYLEMMLLNLIDPNQALKTKVVKETKDVEPKSDNEPKLEPEQTKHPEPKQPKLLPKVEVIEEPEVEVVDEKVIHPVVKEKLEIKEKEEDDQLFIQLMVLGDKNQRTQDSSLWENKSRYLRELKYRRLNFLLNNSVLGVTNTDFIVIVVASENEVIALNEETNALLVAQLVNDILGPRKIYIIESSRFQNITSDFMVLYQNKELPDPNQIQIDFSLEEETVVQEKDPETLLREVFGDIEIEE